MNPVAGDAASRGVDYLLRGQAADGHWEDYRLPTGVSTAWVTAYVGLALRDVTSERPSAADLAAGRAARWLLDHRPYPAGWGYNDWTGPDADSTALAMSLVKATGRSVSPADESWLRERWRPGGGFATYDRPDAWGMAHLDVTPAAYLALGSPGREALRDEVITFLLAERRPDGTWPAYWWRSNLYSTRASLDLLIRLGAADRLGAPARAGAVTIQSALERALALEICLMVGGTNGLASVLAYDLVARQRTDGSWEGGYDLRVTSPTCYAPWDQPEGRLYRDGRGLLTTATAARALARFARC